MLPAPERWAEPELLRQFPELGEREIYRRRRSAIQLVLVCVLGLIPWTVYLALTLPNRYPTQHWNATWTGFDVLLLVCMGTTGVLGWRRKPEVLLAAMATATMLVCDAWFDISLDTGTRAIWGSIASAVLIELPLAAFFLRRAFLIAQLSRAGAFLLPPQEPDAR
jgi:hypothetical protein